MAGDFNFRVRMGVDDAEQMMATFRAAAAGSKEMEVAFARLVQASPQLASAMDGVKRKAEETAAAMQAKGNSTAAASAQLRNLSIQASQTISSLAGGQPVMQVLIQQGHQVADSMLASGQGFNGLGAAARSAFTAMGGWTTLIGTAVAGAVLALGAAAESAERRLHSIQNTLRSTRGDYTDLAVTVEKVAKTLAATTNLGSGEARDAATIIGGSPAFRGTAKDLGDLILVAKDMATVFGTDLPAAAREMAAAMADPAAEARKLADSGFRTMSEQLAQSIKLQQEAGDRAGAFARVLGSLRAATQAANDNLTPLQKAMNDLSKSFTATGNDGKSLAESLGKFVTDAAAAAINGINGLVTAIEKLRQSAAQGDPVSKGAVNGLLMGVPGIGPALSLMYNMSGGTSGGSGGGGQDPTWFAQSMVGVGRNEIGSFLRSGGVNLDAAMDAWCAAFVNASLARAGIQGTGSNMAASFANWGVSASSVQRNDILLQLQSGQSHVGIATGQTRMGPGGQLQYEMVSGNYGGRVAQSWEDASSVAIRRAGAAAAGGAGVMYGPPAPPDTRNSILDQAMAAYRSSGVLSTQIDSNLSLQRNLQSGLDEATRTGNTDAIRQLSEALAKAKGEYTDLITEQEKMARSARDGVEPLNAQVGALREMAKIEQQFAVAARASGRPVDQGALTTAKAARMRELAVEFSDVVAETDRATAATEAIMRAYDGTQGSIDRATNYQRAYNQALKDFIPGSEAFTQAVDTYSAALDRGTLAANRFNLQRNSVAEAGSALTGVVDQVGGAFTNAFAQSGSAALKWQNIMTSVASAVSQALLKMAVLNPLLNALDGGNRGTLSGLFDVASKGEGGGLLGSFGSWIGGLFGGGSFGSSWTGIGITPFAQGGIMTARGPLPLHRYAGGGIANSPQFAMFGEGSTPEAYVPLPDGRQIPVAMKGGGGGHYAPTINVSVANSNASPQQIAATVELAVRRSQAEFIAQINRGGAFAKAVGRRR